ncbi:hypothetical protein HCN44_007962 [Aphidius gifuensis]|uniref:RING-type domain-containing protein n=1 Tax=Aphidius gifuensis TaxID=684658 RepID=A0A834XMV9_APHGI|nr:RING finger protein 212B-like [Aphidius gifuensis]KAF7989288.1 hypothetical protein HCN44_007962 [Aphidius gifuensis]
MEHNWFRCNECICAMKNNKHPFSLTQCGHLFCVNCIKRVAKSCPICRTDNVQAVVLDQRFPPNLSSLFVPTLDVFHQLESNAKFHTMQHLLLDGAFKKREEKYNRVKKLTISLSQQLPKIHDENIEMEKFIDQHSKNYYQQIPVNSEGAVGSHDFLPMPMDISFTQTVRSSPSRISLQTNDLYFSKQSSDESSRPSRDRGYHTDSEFTSGSLSHQELLTTPYNSGEFRVPTSTKVLKSAAQSIGYSTNSISGKRNSLLTPSSNSGNIYKFSNDRSYAGGRKFFRLNNSYS